MASPRAFTFKCSPSLAFSTKTFMDSKPRTLRSPFSCSTSGSPQREARLSDAVEGAITLQEWQGWGTTSSLPAMVTKVVEDLKALEKDIDAQMSFGGSGGKLQGNFKVQEDKKHRKTYQALGDSEQKLQFFAARQIACRLLGSRGYLCQKCWLPLEDCMCSNVTQSTLWHRMRFWLYMHPKDFLRQNNTGKLLWQVFGTEAATLCLFGISEHEEIMWNALKLAGKNNVWCLYPNKNAALKSVEDVFGQEPSPYLECTDTKTNEDGTLNFILIDGTWNNSVSIFSRLKDQATSVWGDADFPCISLATGVTAMHKLRPQPSWDRTCTAGAAIGLLSELQLLPEFSSFGFDKQAEALEDTLVILLEALTTRRVRMGRSITRKAKQNCPVNFENQNYTIITSKCKGPNYPAKSCCDALKEFSCPFADAINDLKNDCATTMFSYINIYGKYPPGLFASQCREGKEGLECPAEAPKPEKSRVQIAATHSIILALTAVLLVLSFNMF